MRDKSQFGPFIWRKKAHSGLKRYKKIFLDIIRGGLTLIQKKGASTSQIRKISKKFPEIEKNKRKLEQFLDFESELGIKRY